jgi:uncharacterized protein (DUF58 family)
VVERTTLLDARTLARLKPLAIRARQVVDGLLTGLHKSPHHGSSIEFSEHKDYSPGDEIRHIDWKAYGRLDRYYVKRFEHESNLRATFVVDGSASMGYGSMGTSKFTYASVLAASLAYLLVHQQDAVGAVVFAGGELHQLPARARMTHLMRLCGALESTAPEGGTALREALTRTSEQATKRGLVFVLSDFFVDLEEPFRVLSRIVSRGHQVAVLQVVDGDEIEFPFEQMTLFEGMETSERLLVEPRLIRERYLQRFQAHQADLRGRCLRSHIEFLAVDTRLEPDRVLLPFLKSRRARR